MAAKTRVFHCSRFGIRPAPRSTSERNVFFDWLFGGFDGGVCAGSPVIGDILLALMTQGEISLGLFVQPLAIVRIEDGLPNNAPCGFGTEIIFSVEPLHPIHHFGA